MNVALEREAGIDMAMEALFRYAGAGLHSSQGDISAALLDPNSHRILLDAAELLRAEFGGESIALGFGELPLEDLAPRKLVEYASGSPEDLLAEYIRVFGFSMCRECPPYETEYHKAEEVFFRSQQMADVAGFYQAFGLSVTGTLHERPDHLGLELEFYAFLFLKQRLAEDPAAQEVCRAARASFFKDHLAWWVPSFTLALRRKAGHGFLAELGRILGALMPIERFRYGIPAPCAALEAAAVAAPEDDCSSCGLVGLGEAT